MERVTCAAHLEIRCPNARKSDHPPTTSNRARAICSSIWRCSRVFLRCALFLPATNDNSKRTILLWATHYILRITAIPRTKSRRMELTTRPAMHEMPSFENYVFKDSLLYMCVYVAVAKLWRKVPRLIWLRIDQAKTEKSSFSEFTFGWSMLLGLADSGRSTFKILDSEFHLGSFYTTK